MILRLLSYNIRHGGTGREEAIAGVIAARHPDIVRRAIQLDAREDLRRGASCHRAKKHVRLASHWIDDRPSLRRVADVGEKSS